MYFVYNAQLVPNVRIVGHKPKQTFDKLLIFITLIDTIIDLGDRGMLTND